MSITPSACQREAIEGPLGPMLVVAGPGAGKTLCLIERIRFLIERQGLHPARICAITFTNKAAEEIAERLEGLGDRARGVRRGTIHALCAEILREHGEWVGVRRGFGIADEDYQLGVLRRIGVPEKWRAGLINRFGLHRAQGARLAAGDLPWFQRYRAHLEHQNLVDFDDLVVKVAELFAGYDEVAQLVAARWDYLLVDEFQDLNPRQYAILKRLVEPHRNVFAVGDDEQSVYAWTGADPMVLREFLNDFKLTSHIVLDENRRTARHIFEKARLLLTRNPELFKKKLRAERLSSFPLQVLGFGDEDVETGWLLRDLSRDQGTSGLPWGEYGVLYRYHQVGEHLEAALIAAGIPCRMARGRALQDDPVVRYLIAALRVIAEPGDEMRQEEFVRVVLPDRIWSEIASEAARINREPLEWMRVVARRLGKGDEDARKIWRADCALRNLEALGGRPQTLQALVEELLSQRVGEYRTILDENHDTLSDPAASPIIIGLAEKLEMARYGKSQITLPRMGGLEIAISGMLNKVGISTGAGGIELSATAFEVFKALQVLSTRTLKDTFPDFVAIDTETTEFEASTCEVVDLAAVRVRSGRIVGEFHERIRPCRPISPESTAVHRITNEMVAGAPGFADVWPRFRAFCGDDLLIAHNGNLYDFPILRRLAADTADPADFVGFDSLPLARQLHPGSRKLGDLAHAFGIALSDDAAHSALGDARALAMMFPRLQAEKMARARKTALAHLLDYLGLALVLSDPATIPEEAKNLLPIAKAFALGRYSDCLDYYRLALEAGAPDAPSLDEVIDRLGGRKKLEQYRRDKSPDERYPVAMARLRRLLEETRGIREFLDRVALSRSDATEYDAEVSNRVNLLTLHSTKGLEFSRVYIVGAEDGQFIKVDRDGNGPTDGELHESRRLLYVGMTRAKDRLVLTRSERRGGMPTGGFRFLTEMGLRPTNGNP